MGANAQTSVPTFTAGEVLTAANMNISARTGIPVFADTTARDAAFGGTGEKTLAEGQYAYIENIAGSAATQFYDGAAWQTLVVGGLTLISTTTIGTTVSSVTVSNAFSSTYDNYLITLIGGVGSTTQLISLQLGATTTEYYSGEINLTYAATPTTATTGVSNGSSFTRAGFSNTSNNFALIYLTGPNLAKTTGFQYSKFDDRTVGASFGLGGGFQNSTTQFTAFTLSVGGTMTGGIIRVYGYANS